MKWTMSCEHCKSPFTVDRQRQRDTARFCSLSCRSLACHPRGAGNPLWRGGTSRARGYVRLNNAKGAGRHKPQHVQIVETVLGRRLPVGTVVHHANQVRDDNANGNLVVLQNTSEHMALHRRLRVLRAGGDPWTDRLCCSCGLKPRTEFYGGPVKFSSECRPCSRKRALRRLHGDSR